MLQRIQDRILAVILAAFSVWAVYLVSDFPEEARFFPLLVIAGIFLLTALIAISSFMSKSEALADPTPLGSVLGFGLLVGVYLAAIACLGFFAASVILLFAVPKIWGRGENKESLLHVALFAAALCVFVFVVFVCIFEVPLPKGLLF
ncbi:MAG: tripartite tricarboxylate transporter TctB family protein [Candidatus Accumulibacter sp.]|jgi:hypothetical protein|nr:tripartite tricarboxylate transporter TctB family protein [Accumulibacter sp.]